jgi:hypothetical protein
MTCQSRLLDELGANATASPVTQLVDGWLLRCAPDLPFRRSNAALPLGSRGADLAATVATVEDFYERRGLPACVQVSTAAPPEIDKYLASRGYRIDAPTDVLNGLRWSTDLNNPHVSVALAGLAVILAVLWRWQRSGGRSGAGWPSSAAMPEECRSSPGTRRSRRPRPGPRR